MKKKLWDAAWVLTIIILSLLVSTLMPCSDVQTKPTSFYTYGYSGSPLSMGDTLLRPCPFPSDMVIKKDSKDIDHAVQYITTIDTAVVNPTAKQATEFLASDNTDKHQYVEGKYMCLNFAESLVSGATATGLRIGLVVLNLPDGEEHAINVFDTTDYGLIFVEPQYDMAVNLEKDWHITGGEIVWNDGSPAQDIVSLLKSPYGR